MIESLKTYNEYIEKAILEHSFPSAPSNLYDPLNYFLKIGGKRIRPALTLIACELFSKDFKEAKHAALAIEFFHNFSLIHDDIMDDAPLRRGTKTVHEKWNQHIAILSGDALLIEAYKELAKSNPKVLGDILEIFNATALYVCEGQQYDMDYELASAVEIDAYLKMIEYKTAVLLGCSLQIGALIGGASKKDAEELYNFGVNLGIAFQLQDDLLDVYADKNKFGKQVGGDILANKKTFLLLTAFENANSTQTNKLNQLLEEKDKELKIEGVKEIYHQLGVKERTLTEMNKYYEIAILNLSHINASDEDKRPLKNLAEFLLNREH